MLYWGNGINFQNAKGKAYCSNVACTFSKEGIWMKVSLILTHETVLFLRLSWCVDCCKRIFRYRLSPETFGYTLVLPFPKYLFN